MIWRERFGVEYRQGRMVYLTEQDVTRCKGVKEEEAGNKRAVETWKPLTILFLQWPLGLYLPYSFGLKNSV